MSADDAMSVDERAFEESLEEELATMEPERLRALIEQVFKKEPAVRKTLQEVLDEPIPREMEKHTPIRPEPYKPRPRRPPRPRRTRRMRRILREFEPSPRWWTRNAPGRQNALQDLYGDVTREGEETRGRRFIRWTIIRDLEKDLTPNFMEKIQTSVSTSFYMRHIYGYRLRSIEDGTGILFYKNTGSPWFQRRAAAEQWLREKEAQRLDPDTTERPNTQWVFEGFFNVEVKVVLDRAPLLGTGPLPDWLRNLAHGRTMVALDTFEDNLCLWRFIAVHRGVRVDRSTKEARSLAKSFFKLQTLPTDLPRTALDVLENVERHLN